MTVKDLIEFLRCQQPEDHVCVTLVAYKDGCRVTITTPITGARSTGTGVVEIYTCQ